MKEDDNNWPMPDRVGRQELELVLGNEHVSFNTTKLGSVLQVQQSKDPEGLRIFYYLVQVRRLPLSLGVAWGKGGSRRPAAWRAACAHELSRRLLPVPQTGAQLAGGT